MSAFDRELESALQSLFTRSLGYTLIGEKPISEDDCQNFSVVFSKKKLIDFLQKSFKNSRCFILNINQISPRLLEIVLIHKPSLLKCIKGSSLLQMYIQSKYGTMKKFFRTLKTEERFFTYFEDSILLGVALGYGEHNARCFDRINDLAIHLAKEPFFSALPFKMKPNPWVPLPELLDFSGPYSLPKIDPGPFFSLEEEWQFLHNSERKGEIKFRPVPPQFIYLPQYRNFDNPESEKVKQKFIKAREKLAKLFCGRSFEEVIVEEARK